MKLKKFLKIFLVSLTFLFLGSGVFGIASGVLSFAFGINSIASGYGSTAFGEDTFAYGYGSTTFGRNIRVYGTNSIGLGLEPEGEYIETYQNKSFVVYGGNSGFNIASPQATVHINNTLKIESSLITPSCGIDDLGLLFVNESDKSIYFCNTTNWAKVKLI